MSVNLALFMNFVCDEKFNFCSCVTLDYWICHRRNNIFNAADNEMGMRETNWILENYRCGYFSVCEFCWDRECVEGNMGAAGYLLFAR